PGLRTEHRTPRGPRLACHVLRIVILEQPRGSRTQSEPLSILFPHAAIAVRPEALGPSGEARGKGGHMVPRVRAIVDTLADERARLERFARSLTEEELRRAVPGSSWKVKDFIAHVATLDAAYIGWFTALAGDPDPGHHRGSPGFDVDRFNESAVAERRDRSVNDLLDEAAALRRRLIRALAPCARRKLAH